jgi:hypothetical protein
MPRAVQVRVEKQGEGRGCLCWGGGDVQGSLRESWKVVACSFIT